jgi:hypothetical protein
MPTAIVSSVMTRKGSGKGLRLAAALSAMLVLALAPPAGAAELTGTWRGTLDGEAGELTTAFSKDGYVLFEYTNSKGLVRTVELTAPGQIRFAPQGGGVTTVAVNSVVKRPGGVSYVLHIGFEPASGRDPDQRSVTEHREYALTNQGLWVRMSRATACFGNGDEATGESQKVEISEGVLKRVE